MKKPRSTAPDTVHRGIIWRDFPGNCDNDAKRFNFALFKRGQHDFNPMCEGLEGAALKARLHELSRSKTVRWKRLGATRYRAAFPIV